MIDEKCHCMCHHSGNATISKHVAPCCIKCHFCSKNISTHSISEHKKRCSWAKMSCLDTELKYFEQHRVEWYEGHAGQFALIKSGNLGTTIHGFFDTYDLALSAGYLIHGLSINEPAPFLIKEVQMRDEVIFMPDRIVIDLFEGIQGDYII